MAVFRLSHERATEGRVLIGATIGLTFSVATLLLYTFGVFIAPLEAEFGWSRIEISGAVTALQFGTAAAAPIYGWLIDRLSARSIILSSTATLAVLVMCLALLPSNIWCLYIIFAAIPLLAGGASPVGYARLIIDTFDKKRGLALGVALGGVGVGAAALPSIAQFLIATYGWRVGYMGLGALTLVIAVPACLMIPGKVRIGSDEQKQNATASLVPLLLGTTVVRLALLFAIVGIVTVAVVAHLVPMMIERGMSPEGAAGAAAMVGIAVIVSRALIGFAIDHLHAPYVLAMVMAALCVALLLLRTDITVFLYAAALLVGFAIGAEVDIMAFLVSRYFPSVLFGRLYGVIFSIFVASSGFGPLLVGWAHSADGSYASTNFWLIGGSILALILSFALPRYQTDR